jgi:Intrinsic membrane protein PufX
MMSDKPYYHEDDQEAMLLRGWVLRQMLRGAGWAAAILTAAILVYVFLQLIGSFLPEESKQAPSPYSQLNYISDSRTLLA